MHFGEDHGEVGVDRIDHQRGKQGVVTKADFVYRDRIVLVDDGERTGLLQCLGARRRLR